MSQKYGMLQEGGYNANLMPQQQQPYPGQGQPPAYQSNQPAPTPAPAYGQATPPPQQTSTVIPATNTTILVQQTASVPWKWSTTIIASFAMWFCCTPLAFCGLLYAIHSYVDHKTQDYTHSSTKLRMAWICTISSIAIGVLFWVIFIIVYAVVLDNAKKNGTSFYYGY